MTQNLDGSAFPSHEPSLANKSNQVSQELRLDWNHENGLSAQIAGMFLYESLEARNILITSSFSPGIVQDYTHYTRYAAVWAKGRWQPTKQFAVDGGLRFNHDDKELDYSSQSFLQQNGILTVPTPGRVRAVGGATETASGLAGEISLSYLPSEAVMFYLRYAHGWKGPTINTSLRTTHVQSGQTLVVPEVEREEVDSVEVGVKSQLWDNRVTWNAAVFYNDYEDIQLSRIQDFVGGSVSQEVFNGDDAHALGVEIELDFQPFQGLFDHALLDGFRVRLTYAWLESEYDDANNIEIASLVGPVPFPILEADYSGNQFANAPEHSFVGQVSWPIPTAWGTIVPRVDWSFKDRVFFTPDNVSFLGQDPLWLVNLRLTYQAPGQTFEVSGWIENLTDQAYAVDSLNLARIQRSILYAIGDPRTYGVSAKFRF